MKHPIILPQYLMKFLKKRKKKKIRKIKKITQNNSKSKKDENVNSSKNINEKENDNDEKIETVHNYYYSNEKNKTRIYYKNKFLKKNALNEDVKNNEEEKDKNRVLKNIRKKSCCGNWM